jgi:hypothetical protein
MCAQSSLGLCPLNLHKLIMILGRPPGNFYDFRKSTEPAPPAGHCLSERSKRSFFNVCAQRASLVSVSMLERVNKEEREEERKKEGERQRARSVTVARQAVGSRVLKNL